MEEESDLYLMHDFMCTCRSGGKKQHCSHARLHNLCTSGGLKMTFTRWHVTAKTSLQVSKLNSKIFSDFMHSNVKQTDELSLLKLSAMITTVATGCVSNKKF